MSSKQPVPFRVTLSVAVRQLRGSKGLSLRDLGDRAAVSHELVNQIEKGLANPSIDIVTQLAKGLNVEVAAFTKLPTVNKMVSANIDALCNEKSLEGFIEYMYKDNYADTENDMLAILANTPYVFQYPWGVICETAKP